ncbi:MAG: MauE/DoxX family redox-associated membrane protein [Bacteroidota bacterium]
MTHTYQLTGMTCSGCEATVKSKLLALSDIQEVTVSQHTNTATITMSKHIGINTLQAALGGPTGKYQIQETAQMEPTAKTPSWLATYKPLLLVFMFITGVSVLTSGFNLMHFMNTFMAGFFLTFSFFKLLDIKGFAESYAMYDVVAKRVKLYGYVYPFLELALGIAFVTSFKPFYTNIATIVVMSISVIGVLQSVLNKRKIQCACLGAVFNLPMSTVTIIEDTLMIVMSAVMLYLL